MRRADLIRHLVKEGCIFVREGGSHSVFFNPATRRSSTVPRHNEIHYFLARKICRDLGIRELRKK
ncbi:type II toxin-antitoxin system HicA family toxin [Candidatus Giovannonibacteria bacterium]|nr:type II toxin-antitoxin system HicA family toxin [Candidatus Giovannonibacteria bacterium]